ncbi:unnamed protein product [Closterium sp. Naga37s-1]|nr:unnamed protein product [Closterium sp. Naga37s-1]
MDGGDETNLQENVKATTVIETGAMSRDEETNEIGKAMAELEEWIEKKVEAISALADAIRTEWESGAAPSSLAKWTQTHGPCHRPHTHCHRPHTHVTDPIPPVTDPIPIVTDPIPPVTDPIPPVTDPIPPVTDPIPPVTDPIPPVTVPLPPVTDPIPPVTDPIPIVTDPIPPVIDPIPPVIDPIPLVTDPIPPVTDPIPPVTDPIVSCSPYSSSMWSTCHQPMQTDHNIWPPCQSSPPFSTLSPASPSQQQHLAALSAHADAIREKVRGVGRSLRGIGGEQAQGGRMEGGGERGGSNKEQSGEEEKDDQNEEEEEEEEAGDGEKEAEAEEEGGEEVGMRDEEEEKTIDLVDETTEDADEDESKRESAGEARDEMEDAVLGEGRGEEPVEAAGAGLGGDEGNAAEREGATEREGAAETEGAAENCENEVEDAEEDAMAEGVGDNYDLVEPLINGNEGGQDKGAGVGNAARDIMRGTMEESAAGEADGPVGNDLVASVERWAHRAGLCGEAAAAAAAAAGRPSQSKGAARGEVPSALVGGKLSDEALKARLQEEIDPLLRQIPPDKQQIQTRVINHMVCFLSSLPLKTQQSTPTLQRIVPETQQLNGNPAAPQSTPELQEITLSHRNLHYFLSLAPTCCPTLLPSLTSLTLDRVTVSTRDMLVLVHLPSLTSLSFLQSPIAPSALSLIQPFSRLHRLVLDCPGPSTVAFKTGPWPLKSLRELHVSRVTNAVLKHVGTLTSLEVLSCTCCEGVSSMGFISLDRLKQLRWLRVAPADLGAHGLRMDYPEGRLPVVSRVCRRPQKKQEGVLWEGVQESEHLKGSPGQADDSGVWCLLRSLQHLEHLELHAPPHYHFAFLALEKLYLLTTLHVTGVFLDHAAFTWLTRVTQLTHLSLAGCTFATDSVVWKLADAMPKLESLDLSGTAITKLDALGLKHLKHLERLTLQQCSNLGASFLRYLRFVPRLKDLDVSFNNMPADWLRHVVDGKQVRRLSVRGCGYKEKTVCGLERPWIVIES